MTCYDIFVNKTIPVPPGLYFFFDALGRLEKVKAAPLPVIAKESEQVDLAWSQFVAKIMINEVFGIFNRLKLDKARISDIPADNFCILLQMFYHKHIDRKTFRTSLENQIKNFVVDKR